MDKNFNDQELSDIMKEIEALEEEFVAETKPLAAPKPAPAPVAEAPSEVLEELVELKEEVAVPVLKPAPLKVAPSPHPHAGTSMSFKVAGDFKLDLNFDVGGKCVALQVHEHGLTIEMDGGATFTIPLNKAA